MDRLRGHAAADARHGPRDLMFVLGSGISRGLIGPREEELFLQGYGPLPGDAVAQRVAARRVRSARGLSITRRTYVVSVGSTVLAICTARTVGVRARVRYSVPTGAPTRRAESRPVLAT